MSRPGTIYGVGLGPGDPDLMSVRAHRLVTGARTIAFFRKKGGAGRARTTVASLLQPGVREIALDYPFTTEIGHTEPQYIETLRLFYEDAVSRILDVSETGEDVVVLCEGDPFFYGSFMHLHARLVGRAPVEVVPGITGMSGCWTATGTPITYGDDILSVVPATLGEDELTASLRGADALVIMKIGRNLPKVRRALANAGLADRAFYVERGTMTDQIVTKLSDRAGDEAPYFSIVLVHGQGRRP